MSLCDRRQMISIVISFATVLMTADTAIVVPPVDVEAELRTSVVFNCSTSISGTDVQWNVYPLDKSMQVIYAFGKINSRYADRFTVQNEHNLHISSIAMDDAGTYECQDDYGRGESQSAELIVLESKPTCRSNSNKNKVVGRNICGIEPSQVTLSCIVQFQGKRAPAMEWKKIGDNTAITSGISNEIRGNVDEYKLTLKGDSITNGSAYNCHLAKVASTTASCNSGTFTVTGYASSPCHCETNSCQSQVVVLVVIIIIIIMIFNAVAALVVWCLFIRPAEQKKNLSGQRRIDDESETLFYRQPDTLDSKSDHILNLPNQKKLLDSEEQTNSEGSWYQCKITINAVTFVLLMTLPFCIGLIPLIIFRRRLLKNEKGQLQKGENTEMQQLKSSVQEHNYCPLSQEISNEDQKLHEKNAEIQQLKARLEELERRLYSKERHTVMYSEKPELIRTITPEASLKKGKAINGLAILGKELFVQYENSSEIEVFDSASCKFARVLDIPRIEVPFDLTAGKADQCLFVLGTAKQISGEHDENKAKGNEEKNQRSKLVNVELEATDSVIVRFDPRGNLIDPWPKPSGGVRGQLSTYGSNLVVCVHDKCLIKEFSRDGDFIRAMEIPLAAKILHPFHAIKVTSVHYAVSHRNEAGRICIIGVDGNIERECGEYDTGTYFDSIYRFTVPIYFIEDDEKSLFVADQFNNQIVLLNWDLTYRKTLIAFKNGEYPLRLCFNESQNMLFVARNKCKKELKDGEVRVYRIK